MKLLAIDGNSIANRAFYGIRPMNAPDGFPTNVLYGFISMVEKVKAEVNPSAVAVAFDMSKDEEGYRPTFRKEMYDDYKAGRHATPDNLRIQMPALKELLITMGIRVIECPGYEADDILGTLAKRCAEDGHECVLYTGDKDSFQLVDDKVKVYLPKTMPGGTQIQMYDTVTIAEKYGGVTPPQMIDIKALMGDNSDNIPGVRGIGEKTAISLIAKYGSIENIYDCLDALPESASIISKLKDGRDSAFFSKTLGTICCDAPIEERLEHCIPCPPDEGLFYTLQRYGLNRFINKWELEDPSINSDEIDEDDFDNR